MSVKIFHKSQEMLYFSGEVEISGKRRDLIRIDGFTLRHTSKFLLVIISDVCVLRFWVWWAKGPSFQGTEYLLGCGGLRPSADQGHIGKEEMEKAKGGITIFSAVSLNCSHAVQHRKLLNALFPGAWWREGAQEAGKEILQLLLQFVTPSCCWCYRESHPSWGTQLGNVFILKNRVSHSYRTIPL